MRLLLHTCCAPCLLAPYASLISKRHKITGFFYNPNIMPYREFRRRLTAFKQYAEKEGIPANIDENYSLEFMLKNYLERGNLPRCRVCYDIRLRETARIASEKGFDGFSTTLTVSPFQDHELIKQAGEQAAEKYHVKFLYQDWRPEFRPSHEKAKKLGLYLQGYCGCIFSEEERYRPSTRKRLAKTKREQ